MEAFAFISEILKSVESTVIIAFTVLGGIVWQDRRLTRLEAELRYLSRAVNRVSCLRGGVCDE